MAAPTKEDLIEKAVELGIENADGMTVAELRKAISEKSREDQAGDASRDPEDSEERAERKADEAKAAKTGPIVKPRKELIEINIMNLYPWAINRRKAESAHLVVRTEETDRINGGEKARSASEIEQAVMDEYTKHGGLVRDQEKASTVGRKKPIKPGMTTDQVNTGGEADDEDDDEDDN